VYDRAAVSRGKQVFLSGSRPPCVMCHGARGQDGVMGRMPMMMGRGMMMGCVADAPRLSGQHATYVDDQLHRFANGERQGTVMNRIAATLSTADMKAVAAYLSVSP
jgi:cytochrome c553